MCGIAGLLSFTRSKHLSVSFLDEMRDSLRHRGPDFGKSWVSSDESIGLAHRRLAIVDLSQSANQPMTNANRSLWLVFNGEIYNHLELRSELNALGPHVWKTDHSDAEVILHAFEQWGIECVQRFQGMFAFALWDERQRELWLVRDRIGIKPLYYSLHADHLTFASEIKALLIDPNQRREVDEEAFYHYLSFLTTPAPQTLFKGIKKLASGTWIRIRESGKLTEYRYWDVLDHSEPLAGLTEEEVSERLLFLLRDSVRLRKMSDVPVGVFLSGGVDSSTNVALFSEGEVNPVKTFSIGYQGEHASSPSELRYAKLMASYSGTEHYERQLSIQDLLDFLERMVYLQDEPLADPVCVPVYYVAQLARGKGVKVCQVGEGADELFCGYPSWKTALRNQGLDQLPFLSNLKALAGVGLRCVGKGDSRFAELLRRSAAQQPLFWGGAEGFTHAQKTRLLAARLRKTFQSTSSWEALRPHWDTFHAKAANPHSLNWMTYLDLQLRLPELLLMRVDKMTMGVSLEARVPFLDHKFVEFALNIPPHMKTQNGQLKYILKKSIRGLIPDQLIHRQKQGFGVPVEEWLLTALGTRAEHEIMACVEETDLFEKNEVIRLIRSPNSVQAWILLNFSLWWKCFIKGNSSTFSQASSLQ